MSESNPYEAPKTNFPSDSPWLILSYYWNALLAIIAFCFHCLPFAAFDLINDGGSTGMMLFPLAPTALIMVMFSASNLLVQVVLLAIAFARLESNRLHRCTAILLTCIFLALIIVTGRFGWFIHA